jgi:uncharacterized membrane protein YhaH (DUF805 family)
MQRLLSYFSFKGRANRQRYWLTILALVGLAIVCEVPVLVIASMAPMMGLIAVPLIIAFLLAGLALAARRLHDRNKSAWWLLLFQGVPLILGLLRGLSAAAGGGGDDPVGALLALISLPFTIWAFVELGCLKGTDGPNRFGDDPLQPTVQEVFT